MRRQNCLKFKDSKTAQKKHFFWAVLFSIKKSGIYLVMYQVNKIKNTMKKLFWIATALFSGLYMFIPEPTDIVPILGWLDEATAFGILMYALKQLGVSIPSIFQKEKKEKSKIITID